MNYKGIIFDLDGTLIDSLEDIADAMNTVLNTYQFPTHTYETYQYFIGSGLRNLVQKALPLTHKNEITIEETYQEMITVYTQNCTCKTKIYPGVLELITTLKTLNIQLSVFSNKAEELTKAITQTLFPDVFDSILGLTTEPLKKPNPTKAIETAKNWQLEPNEIVFVGDSDIDMLTATNANMYAVGVSWGYRTEEELVADGAQKIINHPMELLSILTP
ncbi:HAD family hydrolase [Flavobacterium sp. UMI-01]|uniref:HAD family hydrolase n=1 Tax=Flavobacterium sp. UMI-01 TaxID=1441053 RepID=UPI001C7DB8FA|nr:HAD family hydrolase [Flavobacterium sp. UMI-01]GIZ08251.1 phosphoglycolate phosphatase [Flavobacterium sp. UMI-01]